MVRRSTVNTPPPIDTQVCPAADFTYGLRRVATIIGLGVLPIAALVTMLAVGLSDSSLSADFHHEIYPQAKLMLEGRNPYPPPDFDPTVAANYIWPPLVAYLATPLTALPLGAADIVMLVLGLVCMAAALWLVGLRDWRVYGLVALWPQVAGEMRVSHLTAPLCLLLALAWRSRDRRLAPGAAIGFATALKFLVWPLGVWLASRGRHAATLFAAGSRHARSSSSSRTSRSTTTPGRCSSSGADSTRTPTRCSDWRRRAARRRRRRAP